MLPTTLQKAIKYFSDKRVCHDFMVSLRWPGGEVCCPHCGSVKIRFMESRYVWQCNDCRKQFSVKVGTIFEDSALGLDKWLCAIWMIANAKNGVSSYEVHRALGVTQKSAWFMLHRIREAMSNGTFDKMSGEVEADETFIGGKEANKHKGRKANLGRGAVGKSIVMGLFERKTKKVKAKVVTNTKAVTLQGEVRNNVETGSAIYTDALLSYNGLATDYVHEFVDHAKEYVRGNVHTNSLENFWSLLKRCFKGTYVSCDPAHLFRYLNEEMFRFNEREGDDSDRFLIVAKSVTGKRLTYRKLIGSYSGAC